MRRGVGPRFWLLIDKYIWHGALKEFMFLVHFLKQCLFDSLTNHWFVKTTDLLNDLHKYNEKYDSYADMIDDDWDKETNYDNPKNWPVYLKAFFCFEIGFLCLSVYIGLSIYTAGMKDLQQEFGVGREVALLPMVLFVLGYGVGPLFFAPISEYYKIGRSPVYITTLFLFAVLQIPTAMSQTITSICILRFFNGVFASPVLAMGAASVSDVIKTPYIPTVIGGWAVCSLCGPSLGPVLGAAINSRKGWRWCFWFLLIITGSSLLLFALFLPETYPPTLKFKRARHLRELTGNSDIRTNEELRHLAVDRGFVKEYLLRSVEITVSEPVVLFINIYSALIYSILYLWYETFPMVFEDMYGFTPLLEGVSATSMLVGVILGSVVYTIFIYFKFTKRYTKSEMVYPEVFLPMAVMGGFLLPAGIFIFAWSATPKAHWCGPLIGACIAGFANFIIFETLINYLGMSFPDYYASVIASNGLWRSVAASVAPLYAQPLYTNLATNNFPVGWGSSVLGFIATAMILIPLVFYWNGPKVRSVSKFTDFEMT